GAGKSRIGSEVSSLLSEHELPHALVDLPRLGECWPAPPDDPWNERVSHLNLACVWSNFVAAGAQRLILCRVLEERSLLRHVRAAVPGAEITVIRLRAPLGVLHERIRRRSEGSDASWYL